MGCKRIQKSHLKVLFLAISQNKLKAKHESSLWQNNKKIGHGANIIQLFSHSSEYTIYAYFPLSPDKSHIFFQLQHDTYLIKSVKDVLIKLDIKPCIHLVEISSFFSKSCHSQTYQNHEQSRQKLGTILENKILRIKVFKKKF